MSFAKRLAETRKQRNISQDELAKILGTKGPVIGRYERGMANPSIETAAKIAAILDISLDYLVGNSDMELDSTTLNRILELQQLPQENRDKIFYFIDMSIRDYKTSQAYSAS